MTNCTQPLALPQGASLDLLLRIPRTFADGFFAGWALASQIRGEPSSAFAATLTPEWVDPGDTRILRLRNAAPTTAWPAGLNKAPRHDHL